MTILEIVFATAIFSVIGTALLSLFVTHSKALEKGQNHMAANSIAESILAEQIGLAFKVKDDTGTRTVKRFFNDQETQVVFNWKVTVHDNTVTSPDTKDVVVEVTWKEQELPITIRMVTSVYWQG
jgi:type II secretory pathway pseudopilin PulG